MGVSLSESAPAYVACHQCEVLIFIHSTQPTEIPLSESVVDLWFRNYVLFYTR